MQQHTVPGHDGAPVVTDHDRRLLPQGIEDSDGVRGQLDDVVLLDALGSVALSEAAQVRGHGTESCLGQGRELVAPRIPGLRPPVQQEHQRAFAHLRDTHADPVAFDETQSGSVHVFHLLDGSWLQTLAAAASRCRGEDCQKTGGDPATGSTSTKATARRHGLLGFPGACLMSPTSSPTCGDEG